MKSFDARIKKLEHVTQSMANRKAPAQVYLYKGNYTNKQIADDLGISERDFARWNKFRTEQEIAVFSPGHTIDDIIIQDED